MAASSSTSSVKAEETAGGEGGTSLGGKASMLSAGGDLVPGGTSLGGGSGIGALAVKCASGGEMDDSRPKVAYSGIGGSGDGAKEAGEEVSEHEESDFLRASPTLKHYEGYNEAHYERNTHNEFRGARNTH